MARLHNRYVTPDPATGFGVGWEVEGLPFGSG